eukprot:5512539-Prymnesium_polylepis.2
MRLRLTPPCTPGCASCRVERRDVSTIVRRTRGAALGNDTIRDAFAGWTRMTAHLAGTLLAVVCS